jgi:hypothetical protein
MFDETELNQKFTEGQSQVESALRSLDADVTAIDQSEILFQAGWAAAVAELGRDTPSARAASRVWPALALSFATTTAACLFLLIGPAMNADDSFPVASSKDVAVSSAASSDQLAQDQNVEMILAVERHELATQANAVPLPNRLGSVLNRIVGNRNAQIQRFVAEAASPSKVTFQDSRINLDLEASVPLTPRSISSYSL